MQIDHPLLTLTEVKNQMGRAAAENFLRGLSASDPEAAKAIKEIDAERARRKAENVKRNAAFANDLGLDADGAREMIGKLANDRDLFTWLCARVHSTMAGERPLENDE